MPSRKRIPEETKATIRALKATKDLTLEEIAQRCKVSRTSAHRQTSAEGRVPENRRHFCDQRVKISPGQEALILGSIEEFSSRRLMERTGIRHVSVRTVRRLLNRNGYFFLQALKKGLMSQSDKDMRVTFARRMQADYPCMYGTILSLFTWMASRLYTRQTPWTRPAPPKEECGEKNPTVLHRVS